SRFSSISLTFPLSPPVLRLPLLDNTVRLCGKLLSPGKDAFVSVNALRGCFLVFMERSDGSAMLCARADGVVSHNPAKDSLAAPLGLRYIRRCKMGKAMID
ncbi:MAG TPA: hypothetical protein VFU63_11850, partial [Ktedonobacterales bacterium]|nr:hypothetical protein [Ktedonobacterales bacterium]